MKRIQILGTGCPQCRKLAENAEAAAKGATDGNTWTVEIAIPLEELGFKVSAGRSCVTQLARRSQAGMVSFPFLHGDATDALERFVLTDFSDQQTTLTAVQLGLKLEDPLFRHETIGSGSGTVVGGKLSLLSNRPLHHVEVEIAATDGVRPLGGKTFPARGCGYSPWRTGDRS